MVKWAQKVSKTTYRHGYRIQNNIIHNLNMTVNNGWDSINGGNVNGDCGIGGKWKLRDIYSNIINHIEYSWRLKGLTERTVTLEAGSLFQNLTTHIEKDDILRRHRL